MIAVKKRIILSANLILGFLLALVIYGCVDENEFVEPFPEIDIQFGELDDIYYYNQTLILEPEISYGSESFSEEDFSYRWSLLKEDGLAELGTGKNLEYLLDTIGTLGIYLHVENNSTHVVQSNVATITVESVSNQGWYVLKETADGNTELDGYYVSTELPDYNIVAKHTGESLAGTPVSFAFSPYYKWKPSEESSSYTSVPALMAFSSHGGIAYNVSNGSTLTELEDMFFLSPEGMNEPIVAGMLSSSKVFISKSEGAYTMNDGNPAFFPVIEGDYQIDGIITAGSYGNTLAFDNKNESFVMFGAAGYSTSDTIGYFKDEYGEFNNGLEVPANHMDGQAIFLENTQRGSGYSATTYAYSLFRKNGVNDALTLYGLDYDKFVEGYYYHYPIPGDYSVYTFVRAGQYSPINFEKTLSNSDYPMLTSADRYAMNKVSNILYFAKANSIGMYNIDDETYNESFITGIPGDEEITYMKYVTCNYLETDVDFEGLVVATYQAASDTYKIYMYQLDGLASVTLRDEVKTGSGKVAKMLYVSASSYTWSSNIYQYN